MSHDLASCGFCIALINRGPFCLQRSFRHAYVIANGHAELAGELSEIGLGFGTEWLIAETADRPYNLIDLSVG